jgi:beta-glucosidase
MSTITHRDFFLVSSIHAGTAVMDALLGSSEFSGRLPVTVYRDTADLPPYLDQDMSLGNGRTYR